MSARAERSANRLAVHMRAIPGEFRCPALQGIEDWLRDEKGHGNIIQRAGLALALEAVKALRTRICGGPTA